MIKIKIIQIIHIKKKNQNYTYIKEGKQSQSKINEKSNEAKNQIQNPIKNKTEIKQNIQKKNEIQRETELKEKYEKNENKKKKNNNKICAYNSEKKEIKPYAPYSIIHRIEGNYPDIFFNKWGNK